MPKLIVQVRDPRQSSRVARGRGIARVVVAEEREPRLTHVPVVNFDGTQMIEGVYERTGSQRREHGRLVIRFLDGRVINCTVEFAGQNPVRLIEA